MLLRSIPARTSFTGRAARRATTALASLVLVLTALPLAGAMASAALPIHHEAVIVLPLRHPSTAPTPHALASGSTHPATAAAVTVCGTVDCPLTNDSLSYANGPLLTHPKVVFVRFSTTAGSLSPSTGYIDQTFSASAPNGAGAVSTTLSGSYASWWQHEYSVPATATMLSSGSYQGSITITSPLATASSVSNDQISAALATLSPSSYDANTLFVVFLRAGQLVTAGSMNSTNDFCGYHSAEYVGSTLLSYAVMPNESSNPGCAYAGLNASAFSSMTSVLSHELVEAVTDPNPGTGWADPKTHDEIGDICAGGMSPTISAPSPDQGASYSLQLLYSDAAQSCLAAKAPLMLSASAPAANTSQVTATLSNAAGPISGATLDLLGPSGHLAAAATDANGKAVFTLSSPVPASQLTVSYAGSPAFDGATASPGLAPHAPTGVALLAASTSITASWAAPAASSPAVSSYSAVALPGNLSCHAPALATSCTITGLSTSTSYQVTVFATNAAGSTPAAPLSAVTSATPIPPSAPGQPSTSPSSSSVQISWAAPSSTGSSPLTGYQVSTSPSSAGCTSSSTSCSLTGLTAGTSYTATVTALSAAGSSPVSTPSAAFALLVPITLTLSSHPVVLANAATSIQVTAANAPIGTPVTFTVDQVSYFRYTSGTGTASVPLSPTPGIHAVSATIASSPTTEAASYVGQVVATYGFTGFAKASLSAHSTAIVFSLGSASGPLSASQVAHLAALHAVTLSYTPKGQKPHLALCAASGSSFRCALPAGLTLSTVSALVNVGAGPQAPLPGPAAPVAKL